MNDPDARPGVAGLLQPGSVRGPANLEGERQSPVSPVSLAVVSSSTGLASSFNL